MVQLIITHKCNADLWQDAWKDAGEGSVSRTFADAGIKILGRFRGLQDTDLTGLLVEAESLENFAAFSAASENNPNFLKLEVDLGTLAYLSSLDMK